jgi:hypothetical protein
MATRFKLTLNSDVEYTTASNENHDKLNTNSTVNAESSSVERSPC